MRLLITTQAVDKDDPVLGFFVRWITEIAARVEFVHVICLKEGLHTLPPNVRVHSLGKESGRSRIKYVFRFFRYMYRLRKEYDSVFVHMNAEYVVLGGLWWRSWKKRIVLWRNHKVPGFITRLAVSLAHAVCYTSEAAYVAKFKNAIRMPIGIDTDFFAPSHEAAPEHSVLFLGRLDEVKRPHVFLEALEGLHERGVSFEATIVGDPTDPTSTYAHRVRNRASTLILEGVLKMVPAVSNTEAARLFKQHAIYVNLTPSGSFDKTIGEAAASGCTVVVANAALKGIAPDRFIVDPESAESVAAGIEAAIRLPQDERRALGGELRAHIVEHHSLSLLSSELSKILARQL